MAVLTYRIQIAGQFATLFGRGHKRERSFVTGLSPEMVIIINCTILLHSLTSGNPVINAKRLDWYLYPCSYKCSASILLHWRPQ